METFSEFVSWLNDNETALSAFAALVVIIGVTLSPMGSGLRRALSRRAQDIQVDKAMAPGADELGGQVNDQLSTQDHGRGAASLSDKPPATPSWKILWPLSSRLQKSQDWSQGFLRVCLWRSYNIKIMLNLGIILKL